MDAAPDRAGPLRFVGGYELREELGRGSMGIVYRARQLSLDRDVVVKLLRLSETDHALNELLAKRFRREARATARLDHPNTVRVIDFGQTEAGELYMVLELLRGRSLDALRRERGRLAPELVAHLGIQVCRSLAEAHAAGVIHRDLKPDNVFLCDYPDGRTVAKVMDFGVARLLPHTDANVTRITQAGLTVGTPMYIAPEQARGRDTTPATDLYALGVMLFELLTGAPPFSAPTGMELAIKHIREPPPVLDVPDLARDRLERWRALVSALLRKEPEARPQRAREVIDLLEPLAEPSGGSPAQGTASAAPITKRSRRPGPAAAPITKRSRRPGPAAAPNEPSAAPREPASAQAGPWSPWTLAAAAAGLLALGVLLGHLTT